jgi:hypothetical protein
MRSRAKATVLTTVLIAVSTPAFAVRTTLSCTVSPDGARRGQLAISIDHDAWAYIIQPRRPFRWSLGNRIVVQPKQILLYASVFSPSSTDPIAIDRQKLAISFAPSDGGEGFSGRCTSYDFMPFRNF